MQASNSHSSIHNDLTAQISQGGYDPVASGRFADIYQGNVRQDNGRSIKVAIKAIRIYSNGDGDFEMKQKHLRREIGVWMNLTHDNVLPLLGTTAAFGQLPAMVCPWMENGSLSAYLEDNYHNLSTIEILYLISNVASGLHYLHSCSIVHGDLSGSNILVCGDGKAYISGFGLSILLTDLEGSSIATSLHSRGSLRWIAPELLAFDGSDDDMEEELPCFPTTQSDIYSLGGLILQILSGKVPYYYYKREAQVLHAISKRSTPRRPNNSLVTERRWMFVQRCWSTMDITRSRPSSGEAVQFFEEELIDFQREIIPVGNPWPRMVVPAESAAAGSHTPPEDPLVHERLELMLQTPSPPANDNDSDTYEVNCIPPSPCSSRGSELDRIQASIESSDSSEDIFACLSPSSDPSSWDSISRGGTVDRAVEGSGSNYIPASIIGDRPERGSMFTSDPESSFGRDGDYTRSVPPWHEVTSSNTPAPYNSRLRNKIHGGGIGLAHRPHISAIPECDGPETAHPTPVRNSSPDVSTEPVIAPDAWIPVAGPHTDSFTLPPPHELELLPELTGLSGSSKYEYGSESRRRSQHVDFLELGNDADADADGEVRSPRPARSTTLSGLPGSWISYAGGRARNVSPLMERMDYETTLSPLRAMYTPSLVHPFKWNWQYGSAPQNNELLQFGIQTFYRGDFPDDLTSQVAREGRDPVTSGGFADIYRGMLQQGSGQSMKVAIKAIRTYLDEEDRISKKIKCLRREIKVWLNLRHESILPLLGTTMGFGRFPAMVCPWVENGALTVYLKHRYDSLSVVEVLGLLNDVAAGLKYLHSHSIVHGDLSGSNVLIHANGQACLSDFGLSMLLTEVGGSTFATSSRAVGTLRWTAPELLHLEVPEDEDMDEDAPPVVATTQCDVYSFGSVMLQILSGHVPYHYLKNDLQVMRAISKGMTPQRPNSMLVTARRWLFIQRCWVIVDFTHARPSSEEIVTFAKEELADYRSSS